MNTPFSNDARVGRLQLRVDGGTALFVSLFKGIDPEVVGALLVELKIAAIEPTGAIELIVLVLPSRLYPLEVERTLSISPGKGTVDALLQRYNVDDLPIVFPPHAGIGAFIRRVGHRGLVVPGR